MVAERKTLAGSKTVKPTDRKVRAGYVNATGGGFACACRLGACRRRTERSHIS